MPLLCDIAMILMNFHKLLIIFGLTCYLSAPQCEFLFFAVFLFQVSPILKVLQKFGKNKIKNQRRRSFRNHQGGQREPTRAPGALPARPRVGPRQGGAWTPGGPPGCPPSPIYPSSRETPMTGTLFAISPLFLRRRAS